MSSFLQCPLNILSPQCKNCTLGGSWLSGRLRPRETCDPWNIQKRNWQTGSLCEQDCPPRGPELKIKCSPAPTPIPPRHTPLKSGPGGQCPRVVFKVMLSLTFSEEGFCRCCSESGSSWRLVCLSCCCGMLSSGLNTAAAFWNSQQV